MQIKKRSGFKDPEANKTWLKQWVQQIERSNKRIYEKITVPTSLGNTQVYAINTSKNDLETLVIFPGARTSSLFWDLDNNLDPLLSSFRIYLVETNGLPNLSDGSTPDIKSNDYGIWSKEILDHLEPDPTYIAGASFGGLICMKLCIAEPSRIKAAFLFNPGCLQPFSMGFKNLYYNILPILSPTEKNVELFLDKAVFGKPVHQLSDASEKLLIDYEVFALKNYKDRTQKPYYMKNELKNVHVPTYLFEGTNDLLFPYQTSIKNAREKLTGLKEVFTFENVGHGIETYQPAIIKMRDIIKQLSAVIQEPA